MRVFLSAGEPSGDHHAALLARSLRRRCPDVECVGLGGPQMAAEGVDLVADMTRLAVMWFLRVILSIHRFVDLARRAERSFLDRRPDVCVLVDFPGFHWWLAWRAKRHGIPVVFYCPPQIWAWASWRARCGGARRGRPSRAPTWRATRAWRRSRLFSRMSSTH
jgi:lipid-A-disaccharide synthase